jgi:hypothetical protein
VRARQEVRRRHQSGARARGIEAPQVEIPTEPNEDLWDLQGVKYPGSPKQTDHEPMEVMIVDVRGQRMTVACKKYQLFRNTGTAPNALWLWRPKSAPELWEGRHHHSLTHALRVLQVCSRTPEGHHKKPEDRLLRGGIDPSALLQLCGAAPNLANELISELIDHRLLCEARQTEAVTHWFINTRVRGFDPDRRAMGADEIPEGILPELLVLPAAPVAPVTESAAPAPQPTKEADDGMTATAQTEGAQAGGSELNQLLEVYRYVVSLVPTGADIEDGFAVFVSPKDLKLMVAEHFSLTDGGSKRMLEQLKEAQLYRVKQGGRGKPWRRFVKLDGEEQLLKYQANRNGSGAQHQIRATTVVPPAATEPLVPQPGPEPPVQPAADDSVAATPDQLNQLWAELADKLDEYAATIEAKDAELSQLRQDLADEQAAHERTKQELAAERDQPKATQFVLPASLAKHLGK